MAQLSTTYPAAKVPGTLRVMRPARGLSDRTIAWLFVGPVVALLLAINIFPLLWNIYLSFTNYRANQPGRAVDWFGLRNYERLLTSEDVWGYMQVTAHFVFWTMFFEMLLGFGLAWLINRQFRGHATWTTTIVIGGLTHLLWNVRLRALEMALLPRTGTAIGPGRVCADLE